jgi:DMATS type aromatic prenyltransferase
MRSAITIEWTVAMTRLNVATAARTYGAHAEFLLGRLAAALALPEGAAEGMTARLRDLFGPLAERPMTARAPWPSAISDDSSPFEFSLVLDPRHPELRVLWESQGDRGDLRTKLAAGLATQRRLLDDFGASPTRFAAVADLFLPSDPRGSFVLWHAARLWPLGSEPELKAYLNPQVRGRRNAAALIEDALDRLGSRRAWPTIASAMPRGPELDEILYMSLDLHDSPDARTKVYLQHHDPDLDVLRQLASASPNSEPDEVVAFYRAATADRPANGEFEVLASERVPRPGVSPGSCLSFVGDGACARAVTLHVPIRSHVDHDQQACDRVARMFDPATAALHRNAVEAVRQRRLEDGVGLTSYLSLRSQRGRSRSTCYLSTECFSARPAQITGEHFAVGPSPVVRMVDAYEAEPISTHPFFVRMAREPVDHGHMWLLFSNAYVGISKDFPRRLAKVIAGVEHEQVRCILSEQLYEELGGGELERTHRRLFLRLLEALGRWRPAELPEGAELPGEDLAARLEAIYGDPDPWVGVGAAIVIELLGKQVDLFVGAQFRRQQQLGDTSLEWLTLHEALEVDHAHESAVLAELVPVEHRAAAWRGGRRVFAAGWTYFDEMYALCFR